MQLQSPNPHPELQPYITRHVIHIKKREVKLKIFKIRKKKIKNRAIPGELSAAKHNLNNFIFFFLSLYLYFSLSLSSSVFVPLNNQQGRRPALPSVAVLCLWEGRRLEQRLAPVSGTSGGGHVAFHFPRWFSS